MKNSTFAAFGLVMVVAFGWLGFVPSPLAQVTVTPAVSPSGTLTLAPSTPTLSRTLAVPSATVSVAATRRAVTPAFSTGTPTSTITPIRATPPPASTPEPEPVTAMPLPATLPTPGATTNITATRVLSAVAAVGDTQPLGTGVTVSSVVGAPLPYKYVLALNAQALSIETLRARPYGGGGPIKITRVVSTDSAFQRVLFEYPSDSLRITGMMNIPAGIGPFPVVILDHGYFKPSEYKTGDGTIRAADYFARSGYLTLAPDYRCYGGSQCASNPLDVGYAIDVVNLIAALPSLPYADTNNLGIWGHSMGGGVTIRVLAIADQIKVGALYGAVTGDDETHYCWLNGCRTPIAPTREPRIVRLAELDPDFMVGLPTPAPAAPDPLGRLRDIFQQSSPVRHLNFMHAPIIIHHGESDDIVPIEWSVALADALAGQGKTAVLHTYPGSGHVFAGWNWNLYMGRTVTFFNRYLKPRETPLTAEQRVLRHERTILESSD